MRKQRIVSSGAAPRKPPPAPRAFTDLSDVPGSYTGQAGKLVIVNPTETGLKFETEPVVDNHDVKVTAADTTANYLNSKIAAGTGISTAVLNPAGNEQLQISLSAHDLAGSLHNADTITNLNSKLSDGDIISTKAAEISALTAKGTPTTSDLLIIEDAADANKKKKITIGTLPAAAPAAHASTHALGGSDQITLWPQYYFTADQMEFPDNSDWTVNSPAPAAADGTNGGLITRRLDDSTAEGVGFSLFIPASATNLTFSFKSRAETAPGTAKKVRLNLYSRQVPDNAAVTAWSAATALTDIDIPTNAYFQYDTQTISLATLGLTAGRFTQFELTRNATDGGDTLVGDWDLLSIRVVIS